jgi:predicted RNA-binding protein associated with RNAse of E/G family
MAIRDVKDYYFKMVAQYLEMKADLADFEQALKDGFITEDQMQAAFDEVDKVQQNYERLSYIM